MFCSNCKKEIKDGSTFCYFCGAKIEEIEQERFCPKCGAKLDSDSVFCNVCGAKIEVSQNRDDSSFVTIDIDKTKQKIGTFGNEAKNVINTTAGKISDSAKENVKISSSKIAISRKAITIFISIVVIIAIIWAVVILFEKFSNKPEKIISESNTADFIGTYEIEKNTVSTLGTTNCKSITFLDDGTFFEIGSIPYTEGEFTIHGEYFLSDSNLYLLYKNNEEVMDETKYFSNGECYYEYEMVGDYLMIIHDSNHVGIFKKVPNEKA